MGITNISALFPEGFPASEETIPDAGYFYVGEPDENGMSVLSIPDSMIELLETTKFRITAPEVTNHGDGTGTLTSV